MHDELERTSELPISSARLASPARLEMFDVATASAAAGRAAASRVLGDVTENGDLARALTEGCSSTENGERAAVVAPIERLATMRDAMRRAASARLGLVVHAVAGN